MRSLHLHDTRRRGRGFTLPELLAVIAIVGVLGAVAMATLNGSTSSNNSAALARSLQFSIMNARSAALADGFNRRLNCTLASSSFNTSCNIEKYSAAGKYATGGTWNVESKIAAGSHATIWNITSTTDAGANNAGGSQATGTQTISFYPDGSSDSTGRTIYVADTKASNKSNQFKIYVYSATGMSRLVNIW